MSWFLDLRADSVGGSLATSVATVQATSISDYKSLGSEKLVREIQGQHVLIGIHGFNVNRADGIAHLSNWETLLQLGALSVFVGLLWPGDSIWAHGLDYPDEPRIANDAGDLLAPFVDANFPNAASVSFVSHSLGARVMLRTLSRMARRIRRVTLMAAAIDDNCLTAEFKSAAGNIDEISVLASKKDTVLSTLFPLGNLFGGIIAEGHPWWRAALGHRGPSNPKPKNFEAPFELPDDWNFNHGNYLQIDPPPAPWIPLPVDIPPPGTPKPANGALGWQESWSATFCSTRFRRDR